MTNPEDSEKERLNIQRQNAANRMASALESARKWIVVEGKDQPESKRLEEQKVFTSVGRSRVLSSRLRWCNRLPVAGTG